MHVKQRYMVALTYLLAQLYLGAQGRCTCTATAAAEVP